MKYGKSTLQTLPMVLLLAACQTSGGGDVSMHDAAAPARIETKVILSNSCIQSQYDEAPEAAAILSALGAALGKKVIDKGFDAFAATLEEYAKEKEIPLGEGVANNHAYVVSAANADVTMNEELRCLIVARGNIGASTVGFKRWVNGHDVAKAQQLNRLTGINEDPLFYYEAHIVPSSEWNAFHLKGGYLEYFKAPSGNRKSADVLLTTTVTIPGTDLSKTTVGTAVIRFDDLKPGTVLDSTAMTGDATGWIQLPPISSGAQNIKNAVTTLNQKEKTLLASFKLLQGLDDSSYSILVSSREKLRENGHLFHADVIKTQDTYDKLLDAPKDKSNQLARAQSRVNEADLVAAAKAELDKPRSMSLEEAIAANATELDNLHQKRDAIDQSNKVSPVTFKVTMTEVRDANKTLLAVAEILKSSKSEITTALDSAINPVTRAERKRLASEEAARAAEADAVQTYTDLKAVLQADYNVQALERELADLDQAANPATYYLKKKQLDLAKIEANETRRKAGKPQIFNISLN